MVVDRRRRRDRYALHFPFVVIVLLMARRGGAGVSGRGRWCGDGLAGDFCCSFFTAPRRCLLRRRRVEGERFAGDVAAGRQWLAAGWRNLWALQGLRPDGGRSCSAPRRRRLERADLEVEIEPGDDPRPTSHSDMWALVLLPAVHKALGRWGSLDLGCGGRRSSSSSCGGGGDGWRCRLVDASNPKDRVVIFLFFRVFLASCLALRFLLDRISWVCTYDVPHMSLT